MNKLFERKTDRRPVSVSLNYDGENKQVSPGYIKWSGKTKKINEIGLHHTFREGRTLFHVFSVVSEGTFFRLILNTESLHWELEHVSDGLY